MAFSMSFFRVIISLSIVVTGLFRCGVAPGPVQVSLVAMSCFSGCGCMFWAWES